VDFGSAVRESVNRAACVVFGNYVASEELLRYIVEPFSTGNDFNSSRYLYNQRCNMPPPEPPAPGFTGGQCAGVLYDVTYSYDLTTDKFTNPPGTYTPQSGTSRVTGKVNGITKEVSTFLASAKLLTDGGDVNIGGASSGFANNVDIINLSIDNITRVGGGADDCGDPPPVIPPYEPGSNTYGDNITYVNNEGDTLTIPVVIALGYADIDINGQLSIPVKLDFSLNPELNVSGEFNFNTGDFNPTIGYPGNSNSGCSFPSDGYGSDDTPDSPAIPAPEAPDRPEPDPDAPKREEIIAACIVIVTQLDGKETVVFQDDNPDIILPGAGYVQFLIRVGTLSGWTEPIAVKSSRAFIPCPWEAGAVAVYGTGYYNASIQVIPVYIQRTLQPQFPE